MNLPWRRILRVLGWTSLSLLTAAVLLLLSAKWYLHRSPPPPGQPPEGYSSPKHILAALALKELSLVDVNPPLPTGIVEQKDIEYGCVADQALLLDLYRPTQTNHPLPGLIFIHGGAWRGGKRSDYRVYTTWFAQRQFVVATISYRLLRSAPFPAAVDDVKCAVRWMRAHATAIGVDPNRIGVIGGSAGGHLSMMIGYTQDGDTFDQSGGHPNVSSRVAAIVNLYGPADLTTDFAKNSKLVKDFLQGKTYDQDPDLYRAASPLAHLKPGAPPTLIFHGTIDDVVPIDQSDSLAAKLKQLNVAHEYHRLDGWPHTMDVAQHMNTFCRDTMLRFLNTHLRSQTLPARE